MCFFRGRGLDIVHDFKAVSFSRDNLELHFDGRNSKPASKKMNDIILFFIGTKGKVDGKNFEDFDVPVIFCNNHSLVDLLNGDDGLDLTFWKSLDFFRTSYSSAICRF